MASCIRRVAKEEVRVLIKKKVLKESEGRRVN